MTLTGKAQVIDGETVNLGVITGGVLNDESDLSSDWFRYIKNGDGLNGLPSPDIEDDDNTLTIDDLTSDNNKMWNWIGCWSFCKDLYNGIAGYRVLRGNLGTTYLNFTYESNKGDTFGFRPILEVSGGDLSGGLPICTQYPRRNTGLEEGRTSQNLAKEYSYSNN